MANYGSQDLSKFYFCKILIWFLAFANMLWFCKIFVYLMLSRIESTLKNSQPEEQHGFGTSRWMKKNILAVNLCLQKS